MRVQERIMAIKVSIATIARMPLPKVLSCYIPKLPQWLHFFPWDLPTKLS